MNDSTNSRPTSGAPPISNSGDSSLVPIRPEPDLRQYSAFLEKTLAPAREAWSARDLAEMLFQVLTSQPPATGSEAAVAYFQEQQASAKRAIADAEEGVDHELARGIYYVAISRAWLEQGVWITRLKREEIRDGLIYLQQCQWTRSHPDLSTHLTEVTRRLLA